ncbi:MAG TPA: diguanylate cyclase [Burkholderiaceae bacterium]|nr:diguanylate cyclase [Burkholderiaceae bacterium]
MGLSVAACLCAERYWDQPNALRQLELLGENRQLSVQSTLHNFEQLVDTAVGELAPAIAAGSPDAFSNAVDGLQHRFVDVGAIAWAPRVRRAERAAYEAAATHGQADGHRIMELGADRNPAPAGDRAEYLPMLYIGGEPSAAPAPGVDLASEPAVRKAMDLALETGMPAASDPFRFASPAGMKSAIALLQPVYLFDLPWQAVRERRDLLTGFVVGIVDPGWLVDRTLSKVRAPQGLDVYLFERSAGARDRPLYVRSSLLRTTPARSRPRGELESGWHWSGDLSLANARWTMVVMPIPGAPFIGAFNRARIVLLAGLILTAAVATYTFVLNRFMAEIRRGRDEIALSHLMLNAAMEAAPDGMLIVDGEKRVVAANRRFMDLLQVPEALRATLKTHEGTQELLRFVASTMDNPEESLARVRHLYQQQQQVVHDDIRLADGRILDRRSAPLFSEQNRYLGRIWHLEDVTEARRASARLAALARLDGLTGLINRNAFTEELTEACATAERTGRGFALLFVDLDHFKEINDSRGHPAGDAVLVEVGKRLRAAVRDMDQVARFGGDEFAILLHGAADAQSALTVAEKLRSSLAADGQPDAAVACPTASVGISVYSPQIATPAQLLAQADRALYQAKQLGRDAYCFIPD